MREKKFLHIFGRYFFPHIITGDFATPECHLTLIREMTRREDSAIIFPRGFAKSTWEKIDTLHDIVYQLESVILYISDTLQDAGFHFESIKAELENNDGLIDVYGNMVPPESLTGRKWTNVHFETSNGVNVVARGAGKGRGVNIKNNRPTKIICDDIENDEQVMSTIQRRKLHNWITNVIIPSKDKKRGYLKIIGTVIHPDSEVLKFYHGHGGIFRRAIEEGKSIWPEMWSIEDLFKLRDGYVDESGKHIEGIGLQAFSQEYLNEPVNDETSVFKREWMDQNIYPVLPDLNWLDIKMAVDPNAGQSQMADFMGICVVGRDRRDNKRYVLEARRFKGPITEQEKVFDEVYSKWEPQIAVVEKVMNQTALYQLLLARNKYRLVALDPKGRDKVNRARFVEPLVSQGIIKFSASHVDLYNELIQFPNGSHDDLVDAFVYANSLFASNAVKLNAKKRTGVLGNIREKQF